MRDALRRATVLVPVLLVAGCSAGPAASLELIRAARMGLDQAREAELLHQSRQGALLAAQERALDAAFDADVRLVEAQWLTDADGGALPLSGEWVISARQGYSAALRALHEQRRTDDAAGAVRLDNLAGADEALEMAAELIARDLRLREDIRRRLLQTTWRWNDGR